MSTPEDDERQMIPRSLRIPLPLWEAYGNVCKKLETDRTQDVIAHMRRQINQHGTAKDLNLVAEADRLVERRQARISPGRPAAKGK